MNNNLSIIQTRGKEVFGEHFCVFPEDHEVLQKLLTWFLQDEQGAKHYNWAGVSLVAFSFVPMEVEGNIAPSSFHAGCCSNKREPEHTSETFTITGILKVRHPSGPHEAN
jgi:hypothetical protein